jgi:hypothetical protein
MSAINSTIISRWAAVQDFPSKHELFRAKERRRERFRASITAESKKPRRWFRSAPASVKF